ncbi:MAG: UDP-N-acetylmuramate dehydrogenase [Reichenbachiella sp.]
MLEIKENYSLKEFNTFGIDQKTKLFVEINSIEELKESLKWASDHDEKVFMLGGGSNILLTGDMDCLVVKNNIKGLVLLSENDQVVELKVGGGEVWHEMVLYCVNQGWAGVENMSLIPGSVGAAPIQNIGAYGVELKDVFVSLEALNKETGELEVFEKDQCVFGYRSSVFKTNLKGQHVITSVTIQLNKSIEVNTSYGAINEVLTEKAIKHPSIKDVSDAVIAIRSSKLPDPAEIGNSGSFFKNPVVASSIYDELKEKYNAPGYVVSEQEVKVPAGWLIEQAGWKGKRIGDIGVHKKQALVLVNYGGGTGQQLLSLAKDIQASVNEKFGVVIEPEVNIL